LLWRGVQRLAIDEMPLKTVSAIASMERLAEQVKSG
jgi:hypothetical protein